MENAARRRPLAIALAITLAAAPLAPVFAGPAEDKATARELALEGIAAEGKGDCATAIDRLERAEQLFHAPPHLQYLARCYTKVGRLVDAAETWRKLKLEPLAANAPAAFKDAVAEANEKLPLVEPRLARLTVKSAQSYEGLVVTIDGKTWPSAALDVPRVVDPGAHVIRAEAPGYAPSEQQITLEEGKADALTIELKPGGAKPAPSASASAAPTAPTVDRPSSTWKTVGLVGAGLGAVMLAGGAVTGLSAKSKFDALDRDCPDRTQCGLPDLEDRKQSITRLETTTNILLIGGGVLAAAGLGLFLFAPSKSAGNRAVSLQIVPAPGGGHVGLSGSF